MGKGCKDLTSISSKFGMLYVEVIEMVNIRNNKGDNFQNHSNMRGQSGKLKTDKVAKRPPSLNGINKQLP